MQRTVGMLVVVRNSYPWLRLLFSQINRFRPKTPFFVSIWDNGSTDGSGEWLKTQAGVRYFFSNVNLCHGNPLALMMRVTPCDVVCFMDVDAIPRAAGWLDEACDKLGSGVGAVGLQHITSGRPYAHPSFCLMHRDVVQKLKLDPNEMRHDRAYDVGEVMSNKLEEEGLKHVFIGQALRDMNAKVLHFFMSVPVLNKESTPSLEHAQRIAAMHRKLLSEVGLLQEFLGYVKEAVERNPCNRLYLEQP